MHLPHLSAHRSALATAGAVTAIVALVAGVAVASGGYAAQRVDLGDASVWVASDRLQSVGRANTAVLELNSIVEVGSSDLEVVQSGSTVLVLDPDRASIGIVDPTTSTMIDTVAVPPDETSLALAGSRVVIAAAGDVWSVPVADLAEFDSDAEPVLTFGAGSVTSVDEAGTLFAYTPSTGVVARVDAAEAETVATRWQLEPVSGDPEVQITSVGGRWAVLDVSGRTLHLEGHSPIDLSGMLDPGDVPKLQAPSLTGDEVAIASRHGLIGVGLDGAEPGELVGGRAGTPAAPFVHDGCLHAAWANGSAWRSCAPSNERLIELDGGAGAELSYLANGGALVLNDRRSGRTWAASDDYGLIDNWDELLATEQDEETVEQNDPDTKPTIEKSQAPPVAEADEFGARPGRSTVLPVLLNDYDANGDVLVVDSIDGELPPGARIDLIASNQQLQLTLDDAASGTLAFGYTVTDGRGGTAHATVQVGVREPDENSPPEQMRLSRASVASQGRVTTPVLGDWVDPDGDPFFLHRAEAAAPDAISSTADGIVVFDEKGAPGAARTVSLVVSDGRAEAGGILEISVRAPGDVELVADPFVALATAGQEIRIEPLRYVRGGSGQVRLSAVPAKPDVQLTPDFDGGTFRFTSDVVGTHYLEYTATDGADTATGLVRVEVSAPPERDTTPITVPHTAFLHANQPVDVDVLATDIDPTGGVLIVTGLTDTAEDEGVRVEVIDHRILRVTLSRPLDTGSTTFGYRVSNGLADAEGEVTLVAVLEPDRTQPPVAAPDTISSRTGDVIDIAVLDNDEHPDALPLTLAPDLDTLPAAGLLFVDGDHLRYFAPEEPGEFEAVYRVLAPDGQYATASVAISVRAADPETNTPPVPATVTARVLTGDTVRIPIPLGGADPDGDSVQLLGQESNPDLGTVVDRGGDWLEYQAGEYSAGTDTFQYAVVDALGARATGTVRVGIAQRLDGARAPIAVEDKVTVRPGRTISVRVLENDSDPDGGALSLRSVEPNTGGATAVVDGDRIEVTVPDGEGLYGFIYTVENEHLGEASSFLTVEARPDAPLARPEASDTVLSLSDILDKERIDVPVLRNVFLADAPAADLTVGLVDGYTSGVEVRRDGSIRVEIQDRRRIIPFSVSHPEDPDVTAYAFIWVPGRDDALPQLRRDAPRVEVVSGEEVRIELAEFVIAASGRPVRLTDAATVRASHDDGTELVVDQDSLRYQSENGYFGPASLSFTVTDGESAADPTGRTGTIVIPITVLPTENQPPVFTGGVIDFEPGQSKTIELMKLTNYPYPDEVDRLEFEVLPPFADGFEVSLAGDELTIAASESTVQGTRASVAVGVTDPAGAGRPGRIDLRVVPSTRPLAEPADDHAIAPRGQTTSIDVLANDRATNPFPETPLRVVGVRGLDESLPAGVTIEPSSDRSTLAVSVDPSAAPVNTTLQYQVADATDDPSRYAWGTVTISVQDRPDPVTGPQVTGFADGTLDVTFGAGGFNNSPISGYEIALLAPGGREVVQTSTCAATTCTVATPGNGEANAVIVRIQARNGIGLSDPVEAPGPIWSDVVPPPPTDLRAMPLDGRLRIEWAPVSTGAGSTVGSYVVTVAGVSTEVSAASACTATLCGMESQSLENGSQVPFTVSARNEAYPALTAWNEAGGSGTPFGAPVAGAIAVTGDALAGSVTVSWSPFSGNGDAIGGYFVQRLVEGESSVPSGPQACGVTSPAPGTVVPPATGGSVAEVVHVGPEASSVQFAGTATEAAKYSFLVWGFNRAACVNTEVASTVVRPAPGGAGPVKSAMAWMNIETWDRYIEKVDGNAWRYEIVAVDSNGAHIPGSVRDFSGSGWLRPLLNRPFGEAARFQVRACTLWGSCGPWSQTQPADAVPSLTFALPSRVWNETTKTWSWTAAPENSGLPAAFWCGVDGDTNGRLSQSATTCEVPEAQPGDRVWLDVEVAGVTARYENR
ncbi:fibronectin type III domain-containing protein [Agromyces sp. ISL-38]|uniref:Ig-like domain-containing protein n=1 Tax=Agromyces sp. ISL-38 TaxID=2819107 RepID=UPI001BE7E9D3|nr:Ig-like domain-containing protein [Agromyces sp. ISL-38]MBT2498278.1 fibronectin type III domain-containing protein [Agromyces sp. ISL-38]